VERTTASTTTIIWENIEEVVVKEAACNNEYMVLNWLLANVRAEAMDHYFLCGKVNCRDQRFMYLSLFSMPKSNIKCWILCAWFNQILSYFVFDVMNILK
jgi:hypothetical protein